MSTARNMALQVGAEGVPYFQFRAFQAFPMVAHALFTREGGVSQGPFSTLNVGGNGGDDPWAVSRNLEKLQRITGGKRMVSVNQVHGTEVVEVTSREGAPKQRPDADALITNIPGVDLLIKVADCQPVLLYEPEKGVVANIHSGWRGSVNNIVGKTVRKMRMLFSCDPGKIIAGVGPSLGPCCAEFVNYRKEIPEPLWPYKVKTDHFDFWRMTKDQLAGEGVPQNQIFISGLCTRCRTDLFFSYRGEGVTGRSAAVIGLREKEGKEEA